MKIRRGLFVTFTDSFLSSIARSSGTTPVMDDNKRAAEDEEYGMLVVVSCKQGKSCGLGSKELG